MFGSLLPLRRAVRPIGGIFSLGEGHCDAPLPLSFFGDTTGKRTDRSGAGEGSSDDVAGERRSTLVPRQIVLDLAGYYFRCSLRRRAASEKSEKGDDDDARYGGLRGVQ